MNKVRIEMADNQEEDYQARVRHDLKNKIQIIQGYLELTEDMDLPEEAEELISKSANAVEESKDLLAEWKRIQLREESE
ncbi:hypothetical protein AKJ41_02830 [candidate division MSBL1 archaeon SCGC-AAA259O05]|uniref:SpoOB alpha-helical domain-containing protein n=2 Tax=candidate division MSBL1 TaxID=215777 RepID=A0A133V3Q7_9EURY|nr:hypothetical protein AKJ64_02495 [candidate division MSBL1 archaeon SCGC-AAA259E17]KXB01070.1 hypothetical protein AKJ41_02830 [candidate division MSBL1 archaeon SCGC-AAA259O05]